MRTAMITALAALGLGLCGSSVQASPEDTIVAGWYDQYLGRHAYADELPYWADQLRQGTFPDAVRAGIMASDEYLIRHGRTREGFVAGLYSDLLGRAPNAQEAGYWLDRLPFDGGRLTVTQEFIHDAARDLAQSAGPANRTESELLQLPQRIAR